MLCSLGLNHLTATDYYIRSDGDDAASGISTNTAWRTIERVNRARLQPGDRGLFEAGLRFAGNLRLTAEDAGTSNAPVVIGSQGQGRVIILAGTGTGVTVENAGGITIENLVIAGAGRTNNTGCGILCNNTLTDSGSRPAVRTPVSVRGGGGCATAP